MKVELRKRIHKDHETFHYDLLLFPTKEESELIDQAVGSKVTEDGFIADVKGEVRFEDGYATHYIRLAVANDEP